MLIAKNVRVCGGQDGFILLESLLAILIFSLGILGMVALNARAIEAATDAEFRTEAAKFADEIATQISLNVDRTTAAALATDLATYAHQATGTACGGFSGAQSSNAVVTDWLDRLSASGTGLPGAAATGQQIRVDSANFNRVVVTLCWQPPNSDVRQHTLMFYVN